MLVKLVYYTLPVPKTSNLEFSSTSGINGEEDSWNSLHTVSLSIRTRSVRG